MSILNSVLSTRDLVKQISNSDAEIKKIYAGFDGTAESLQIGNLTPIAALRHLAKAGIKPIILLGGATSTVGDPSGKNTTRKQLKNDSILKNINCIKSQMKKLIPEATIVNNNDWLGNLSFMEFLDKVAQFTSVSSIINLKTFVARLENNDPFNMKELLYPLMQGYDFLWLYENMGCDAQLGGQDQWCNLLTGTNLIQKKYSNETPVVAVTAPLLTDSNGQKMGKSLSGAIYLSEKKIPVYDFWNFWRNVDDSIVKTCLLRFSDFEPIEIDDFIKTDINDAKVKLADFMTTWVHSKEATKNAKNKVKTIFIDKNYEELIDITVSSSKLSEIVAQLKNISMGDAKRLIEGNAVKVNNETIKDISFIINLKKALILIGKKDAFKIVIKS